MTIAPGMLPADWASVLELRASALGRFRGRVSWYGQVPSTNDIAGALAGQGAPEGVVVTAGEQTAGRGRLGRAWASPAGAGLYTSVLLRPPAHAVGLLTLAAGLAVAVGVHRATGLRADVKWPNDVYVGNRKLAGILAEAGGSAGSIDYVVLGFGINVLPTAYPPDVAARATSLEYELGRAIDPATVLAECLVALEEWCDRLYGGGSAVVIEAWRERAVATFGREVEWEIGGGTRVGIAEDIDGDGALLVRSDGATWRVRSGEVRWRP